MSEVVVVAGMSGAGRSTAGDNLEDLGWFVMDNLPPALIPKVAELADGSGTTGDRLALVVGTGRQHEVVVPLIGDLRQQGEAAAREVREHLDQISPGLGNPVMSVQVEVDEPMDPQVRLESDQGDSSQLQDVLARIDGRLQRLDALMNKVS